MKMVIDINMFLARIGTICWEKSTTSKGRKDGDIPQMYLWLLIKSTGNLSLVRARVWK